MGLFIKPHLSIYRKPFIHPIRIVHTHASVKMTIIPCNMAAYPALSPLLYMLFRIHYSRLNLKPVCVQVYALAFDWLLVLALKAFDEFINCSAYFTADSSAEADPIILASSIFLSSLVSL